jgi:hypothetical protein
VEPFLMTIAEDERADLVFYALQDDSESPAWDRPRGASGETEVIIEVVRDLR